MMFAIHKRRNDTPIQLRAHHKNVRSKEVACLFIVIYLKSVQATIGQNQQERELVNYIQSFTYPQSKQQA